MTQFARDFVTSIEGTNVDISTKELSGGARIYYIFNDVFGNALANIEPTQSLENQDIRTAIRNSTGPRPSLFVPEIAFDLLVKPQIKLLEAPSLRCVELVYEELVKICHNCTSSVWTSPRRGVLHSADIHTPLLVRNFNVFHGCMPSLLRRSLSCCVNASARLRPTLRASSTFKSRISTRTTLDLPQRRHKTYIHPQPLDTDMGSTHHG
jgi:hypothetical protein